jgi:hypothetical protein
MQNDARRIDDAPQRVAPILVDLFRNGEMESGEAVVQAGQRVLSLGYLLLDAKQHGAGGTNHRGARFGLNDHVETGIEQEIVKRGQQAVQAAYVGIAGFVLAARHLVRSLIAFGRSPLTKKNGGQTLPCRIRTAHRADFGCIKACMAKRSEYSVGVIRRN